MGKSEVNMRQTIGGTGSQSQLFKKAFPSSISYAQ